MRRHLVPSLLVLAAAVCLAGHAGAQTLNMGNVVSAPNSGDFSVSNTRTDIDLVQPATASGTIDSATFSWSAFVCPAAAKIKVFRRQADTLVFIAERGPFDVTSDSMSVSLTPPIVVQQGDLLGIARVSTCGNPTTLTGIVSAGYAGYVGDLTSNVSLSGADVQGAGVLSVHATGTATESIAFVLAAAGSTPGNFGSFFRTGVQLYNPGSVPLAGRFVYHPAGVSGSSSDPTLNFTIDPQATIFYDDLVQTMGQSGLGTLDLVLPASSQNPVILARVYNDAGAAGTSGFTEEAIDPNGSFDSRVLFAGSTSFLITPSNPAQVRFNIGVRSLLSGASVTFRVRDASGAIVRTVTKDYEPTFYEQQSAQTLLGGPIGASDTVEVSVSSGSAIIYGAAVDNTTNDPSIQFARVVFAIASLVTGQTIG